MSPSGNTMLALALILAVFVGQELAQTPSPRPTIPTPSPPSEGNRTVPPVPTVGPSGNRTVPPVPTVGPSGPSPPGRCPEPTLHFCGLFEGQPECITRDWVCDDKVDCKSDTFTDEDPVICSGCEEDEYACPATGECIPAAYHCDRTVDCPTGDDETNCTYAACPADYFTCKNQGHCIPNSALCDNKLDCGDSSDESVEQCADPESVCKQDPGSFFCKNGNCIAANMVCSGSDDCGDNSDEIGCGVDECKNSAVNPCQEKDTCINYNIGFACGCKPGFVLKDDKKSCKDVDECSTTPYNCTQLCKNTAGSYQCSCASGYTLQDDGKTCRADGNIEPFIMFANRFQIRTMSLNGTLTGTVNEENKYAHVLDYDYSAKIIYFADAAKEQIRKINFDGTNETVLIKRSVKLVEGIAFDWITLKKKKVPTATLR